MKNVILIISLLFFAYTSQAQCAFTVNVSTNSPTCYGFCDGSLTLAVQGATGMVTYEITDSTGTGINGGSNTANFLCQGWYYWSVTDESPCTETDSIYIDAPDEMTIDWVISDALCYGDTSGNVVIDSIYNMASDMNGVSCFWNPAGIGGQGIGSTSQYGLGAGSYTLTVNDDNGCSEQFDFTISQPPALVWSDLGSEPDSCNGNLSGVVYMAGSGGTPDYDYEWTDLQNMNTANNTTWGGLGAGCYAGKVTDANGCEINDTICIGCLGFTKPEITWELYPNPSNGSFSIVSDHNGIAQLKIYNMAGAVLYQTSISNGKTEIDLEAQGSGIYWILLETDEGIARRKIIIE